MFRKPQLLDKLNRGGGVLQGWGSSDTGSGSTGGRSSGPVKMKAANVGNAGYSINAGYSVAAAPEPVSSVNVLLPSSSRPSIVPLPVTTPAAAATPAPAPAVASMWQLVYDPTSGGSYYYNSETGESQWERPQNYWTPRGHESTSDVAAAADAAYDPNADASTGAQAGIGAAEEEWVDPNVLRSHGPWRVYFDADSGYEYYHNTETEEVVWDPPVPELAPDTPYDDDEEFFDGDADGGDGALAAEGPLAGMSAEHLSNVAAALCYNRYKPAVPHPLAKHGPWELFLDPDAQKMYYCNSDTGQSLWEVPPDWNDAEAYVPPLAKFGDWQVYRDHTSLAEYYTNAELGQTTWEVPAALLVQVRTVEMQESQLALEAAKAQAAEEAKNKPDAVVGDWEVHTDPETQHLYYVNVNTGESRWEAPDEVLHAHDEVWETPAEQKAEADEYDDDFETDMAPKTPVAHREFGVSATLGRVESGLSVATDAGAGGGRVADKLDPLEGVMEVEDVEDVVDELEASDTSPTLGSPMRGRHVHGQRQFGKFVGHSGIKTAQRDGRGRILVAPKAPVARKFWEAKKVESHSDDEAAEEKRASPLGRSLIDPSKALEEEKAEREKIEAGYQAAEEARQAKLAANDREAQKEREAKEKAAAEAKEKERKREEWNKQMAAAKKKRDEQEAERRKARRASELARRKDLAAKARRASAVSNASDGKPDQPAPPKFRPGGALGRMNRRASGAASPQVSGGTALLMKLHGSGSGRGLGSPSSPAVASPKAVAGSTTPAPTKPATPPTIPKWMQNIPKPPTAPAPMKLPNFGGSFKRPMFSFGAKRAFSNKPKEAAPGTSPEKAAKEDKPEDAKPPPPKSARREANETDDWIRERIEAVKEQKRKEAEETVKKLNDSRRLGATGGKAAADDDEEDDDYASDGFESAGEGGSGEEKSGEGAKSPAGKKAAAGGEDGDDGEADDDDEDDGLDEDAVKAMIKRLGLSESDTDAFMQFREKHAATAGSSKDTLAQQYAAYLAFKEASDMADLKTRMAGMNERIAKLEEAKLKHRMAQQRKRAEEMAAWEREAIRLKEQVRKKRAAKLAARAAKEEAEAAKRRAKFMERKARQEKKAKARADALSAKKRAIAQADRKRREKQVAARTSTESEAKAALKAKRRKEMEERAKLRAKAKAEREELARKAREESHARLAKKRAREADLEAKLAQQVAAIRQGALPSLGGSGPGLKPTSSVPRMQPPGMPSTVRNAREQRTQKARQDEQVALASTMVAHASSHSLGLGKTTGARGGSGKRRGGKPGQGARRSSVTDARTKARAELRQGGGGGGGGARFPGVGKRGVGARDRRGSGGRRDSSGANAQAGRRNRRGSQESSATGASTGRRNRRGSQDTATSGANTGRRNRRGSQETTATAASSVREGRGGREKEPKRDKAARKRAKRLARLRDKLQSSRSLHDLLNQEPGQKSSSSPLDVTPPTVVRVGSAHRARTGSKPLISSPLRNMAGGVIGGDKGDTNPQEAGSGSSSVLPDVSPSPRRSPPPKLRDAKKGGGSSGRLGHANRKKRLKAQLEAGAGGGSKRGRRKGGKKGRKHKADRDRKDMDDAGDGSASLPRL